MNSQNQRISVFHDAIYLFLVNSWTLGFIILCAVLQKFLFLFVKRIEPNYYIPYEISLNIGFSDRDPQYRTQQLVHSRYKVLL